MRRLPLIFGLALAAPAAAQTCGPAWSALGSGLTGNGDEVLSLASVDDGGGSALFAAGGFSMAGGQPAIGFAKWAGTGWVALNAPGSWPLAVFDDGRGQALYAYRGRWNGSSWEPFPPIPGITSNPIITAAVVYDDGTGPGLYFTGVFSGGGFNNIARWDGHAWSNVGGGVTMAYGFSGGLRVSALAVYDDDGGGPRRPGLYAIGDFLRAGNAAAFSIARWDGATWEAVRPGFQQENIQIGPAITSAGTFNGELYVSGSWFDVGGINPAGVARWNGSRWADAGGGFNGQARAMLPFDDGASPALFVTGGFSTAGGMPAANIARWNGSTWSTLGSGLTGTRLPVGDTLAIYDSGSGPALYVGGTFAFAGDGPANNIARWGLAESPANCDGSRNAANCPTLDVNDFMCFMGRFAAHDQRANCDASSRAPTLNVNDFICFQQRFAAGCP